MYSLDLHDALALGQYESALAVGLSTTTDEGSSTPDNPPDEAPPAEDATPTTLTEMHRLPLLLRLLSASRPLSSLPNLTAEVDANEPTLAAAEKTSPATEDDKADAWLDKVVQGLEDRAALYSAAEGVEVLAGHLAPHVCRKWSKLSALPRQQVDAPHGAGGLVVYDPSSLEQAVYHGGGKRRKLSETSFGGSSADEGNVLSEYNTRMEGVEEDGEEEAAAAEEDAHRHKRRKQSSSLLLPPRPSISVTGVDATPPLRRQSTATLSEREFAAEDSQQALATKSWTELALLVAQSLRQPLPSRITHVTFSATFSQGENGVGVSNDRVVSSSIALSVDEASILAQAQSTTKKNSTRGLMSADLSATLASLLHHTPVLRYDHVAVSQSGLARPLLLPSLADNACSCCANVDGLVSGRTAASRRHMRSFGRQYSSGCLVPHQRMPSSFRSGSFGDGPIDSR